MIAGEETTEQGIEFLAPLTPTPRRIKGRQREFPVGLLFGSYSSSASRRHRRWRYR